VAFKFVIYNSIGVVACQPSKWTACDWCGWLGNKRECLLLISQLSWSC